MSGTSAASIWAGYWCLLVLHVCFCLRTYVQMSVLLCCCWQGAICDFHISAVLACLYVRVICFIRFDDICGLTFLCFFYLITYAVCVCVCPSIDRTHATHARLSCCKSSPDIRAHGDLQYSVAVIDDRCVWQFSVWGRRADSDSANHTHVSCVCVRVCAPAWLRCWFL